MAVNETDDALTALQMERGIELDDKMQHIMERWAKIVDNARYLIYEHMFKEKEYGIKWRLVYEDLVKKEAIMLRDRFGSHLEERSFSDLHIEIAAIVEKDFKDVTKFAKSK